jgi:hypothetical protein
MLNQMVLRSSIESASDMQDSLAAAICYNVTHGE